MTETNLSRRRQLFKLTWPLFLELILYSVIGSVDTLMLNNFDTNATGAVGNVNQILGLFQVLSNIITAGTGILLAQYIGAGKSLKEKQPLIIGALMVNALLGVMFSLAAVFGTDILLDLMRVNPEHREYCAEYMRIVGGFLWVQMLAMTFSTVIRTHGKTTASMIFSVVMNLVNVGLNVLLIYGVWIFPKLGVSGAAIATVVSKCLACAAGGIYTFFFVLKGMSLRIHWKDTWKSIKSVVAIGSPAAGEQISYTLSKIVVMAMINSLSAAAVDTYALINTIVTFVYLLSMALGQGTSIIIGWEVGKGTTDEAKKLALFSTRISTLMAMVFLGILIAIGYPLLNLLNPQIVKLGMAVLVADILLELGRSRNLVLVNALRAAGDVRYPLYVGLFSMWFFSVGLSWLLGIQFGWGLVGIWLGLGMDEFFRAVAMQIRWQKGTWIRFIVKK
jgi:putative MATE family efflux protein